MEKGAMEKNRPGSKSGMFFGEKKNPKDGMFFDGSQYSSEKKDGDSGSTSEQAAGLEPTGSTKEAEWEDTLNSVGNRIKNVAGSVATGAGRAAEGLGKGLVNTGKEVASGTGRAVLKGLDAAENTTDNKKALIAAGTIGVGGLAAKKVIGGTARGVGKLMTPAAKPVAGRISKLISTLKKIRLR